MADNIIKVNVTANKPKSVTVSSANVGTEITASSDTGRFWAQTAKNWAVSDVIVDNTDYSSKHYALEAKESASNAQGFESAIRDVYNGFLGETTEAIENIQGARDEARTNIETLRVEAVDNITTAKDEAVNSVTTAKSEAIDNITSTKTTILNDIEFVADGEKKEIEDLIDNGKEELKESIGDVKILTTLEIGDIGIAPLGIDETKGKRRYLNGQVIIQDQYVEFTNKVKSAVALYPSLACTESEWQTTATMTVGGQVGKFVVDDEAGTIRLPKIIMPIQGLTDLSKLGEIVNAGLPQHTHSYTIRSGSNSTDWNSSRSGLCSISNVNASAVIANQFGYGSNASNSIYGKSTTVQQEQIQYPYFIQVATGAETEDNIINEIELNNPFSLLDYKYSEYELNNLSWLRSNGQYNSKIVYPAVYDLLLKIYNGVKTKAGVSVKLSTGSYTDYDFVLNTAEETFRLPIKVKLASGKAVVGNGMALGVTNGEQTAAMVAADSNSYWGVLRTSGSGTAGTSIGTSISTTNSLFKNGIAVGITTDPTKSGIETSDSDLYLYFYVGETVQNANLINAGRIEEKIVNKADTNASNFTTEGKSLISSYAMPSSKSVNLTLGASGTAYTAPANGWVHLVIDVTANGFLSIQDNYYQAANVNGYIGGRVPFQKGQNFYITYSNYLKTVTFKFYYAQGEV